MQILDSAPEERFDRLTRLAKRLFGVPIALVSLVDQDRRRFKASGGMHVTETPREVSFCGHAQHNAAAQRGHDRRFSVGAIAYDPSRHGSVEALVADADARMYASKRERQAMSPDPAWKAGNGGAGFDHLRRSSDIGTLCAVAAVRPPDPA